MWHVGRRFNVLTVLLMLRKWKVRLYFSLYTNTRRKLNVCIVKVHLSGILFTGTFTLMSNFCVESVVISTSLYFPNNLTSVINTLLFLGGSKWGAVHFIVWNVWICSLLLYFFISAHTTIVCVTHNSIYLHTLFLSDAS